MGTDSLVELAIDTVGTVSSVAISDRGRPLVEVTWQSGRRHTTSLIPTIDYALRAAGIERSQLHALFVDVGPGAYSGIRAGMAAAEALALALPSAGAPLPAVGVGRLEIEAYAHAAAARPIAAVQDAGRGQAALALYHGPNEAWIEKIAPKLYSQDALIAALADRPQAGVLCGDIAALPADTLARLTGGGWTVAGLAANIRRAGLLAELGWRRLQAGGDFHPARLEPIYLREPSIGPQSTAPAAGQAQEKRP